MKEEWSLENNFGEDRVIRRYIELAGLIDAQGNMVNRDKESRAREWVKR